MELDLDIQFLIFQITYDINIYFRRKLIDDYLEFIHFKMTPIDERF